MNVFDFLADIVDRELRFWGKPVISILASCLPILAIDLMFDGAPADQPMSVLVPVLSVSAAWGAFVVWRSVRFEIHKFKQLRALGAEEANKRG